MNCRRCGNEVAADAAFCSSCGAGLARSRFVPSNVMIVLAAVAAIAALALAIASLNARRREAVALAPVSSVPRATPSAPPASPSPTLSPSPATTPGTYQVYRNRRYDYSLSYPADLLVPGEEEEDGSGRQFASSDGSIVVRVWGAENEAGVTIDDLFAEAQREELPGRPARRITYQVKREDWFVISGYEGGRVFYQKTILRDSAIKTLRIESDEAQQAIVGPMTERIAASFGD